MTEIERKYFSTLVERRKQRAETKNDPEFQNAFENTIDKYTDQAHFVYELLQNADDAGATYVRFVLEKGRLLFAHNGTKRFFVSNPETVMEDKKAGVYGSVNSITAIGFSNKPDGNAIGKFGIGFMSVFQYSDSPEIFDPNICFRIRDLIIPELILETEALRARDETLFIFPLGTAKCAREKAFEDISKKLRNLPHPLMFLNTLEKIDYWIDANHGVYLREEISRNDIDGTTSMHMRFTCDKTDDGEETPVNRDFWFFSRGNCSANRYSVCFALNDERLEVFDSYAFCFFPTKTATGLHFAIHAPFLLTDNREGIKAAEEHNIDMVHKLAILAADSLEYLRDIGTEKGEQLIDNSILDIIPINPNDFEVDDTNSISFMPFYTTIRDKLCSSQLLPTADGYVFRKDAYWADTRQIEELISQKQLARLTDNPSAQWAFPMAPRNERQRIDYIRGIAENRFYNNLALFNGLSEDFLGEQPMDWLNRLYQWLLSVLGSLRGATDRLKTLPVFRNRLGHAVAAYDNNNQHILFLNGNDDEKAVCDAHLKHENAKLLLQKLEVGEVSPWDDLYNNVILPCVAKNDGSIAELSTFQKFYLYYCDAVKDGNEPRNLVKELEKHPCILFRTASGLHGSTIPNTAYFPETELITWFETKPSTMFVDSEAYSKIEDTYGMLREFLSLLGVQDRVKIREHMLYEEKGDGNKAVSLGLHYPQSDYYITWKYPEIDGLGEVLSHVIKTGNFEKSKLIWNSLISIIVLQCPYGLAYKLSYSWSAIKSGTGTTPIVEKLRKEKWVKQADGSFVSPCSTSLSALDTEYIRDATGVSELIRFLGIVDDTHKEDDDGLTDEQRENQLNKEYADFAKEFGCKTPDELRQALEWYQMSHLTDSFRQSDNQRASFANGATESCPLGDSDDSDHSETSSNSTSITKDLRRIGRRLYRSVPEYDLPDDLYDETEESDGYALPPIDFSKKVRREENKNAKNLGMLYHKQELWDRISASQPYSYIWFRAMLELEMLESGENDSDSRAISIRFGRVEPDPDSPRGLLLKWPNKYVPQSVEELDGFALRLDGNKELKIESACVKGSVLQLRMRSADEAKGIDLSSVAEASIDVQSPDFLLRSLLEGFSALGYADDFDMRQNLCENIRFVFGPPGTGKTTHLVMKELLPMMQSTENVRVLVLTPTNKSADVLAQRIIHEYGKDRSYEDWLVRFGRTFEREIEDSPVLRDRSFDLLSLDRCVVVTTIDRFPYDGFCGKYKLNEIDWDYIIVDEASMIPLFKIVYPLYCQKPKEFIIAGDPLQIQPVVKLAQWQDENIYKMVGLRDFGNPVTQLHDYQVTPLYTQYRSVPAIGELFSRFAYKGRLKHARSESSLRPLHLESFAELAPLSIIEYPVRRYEGVYKAKRLDNSPYQIYSALFAYEFVSFLCRELHTANPKERFSIGVVSPYRIQANLIGRLLDRNPPPTSISVLADTIHGFQGDECDIILAVVNPPVLGPRSDPEKVFANRETIINVAISRAKDYLFALIPDSNTDHLDKLPRIMRLRELMENSGDCVEYSARELEALMFGREDYIEQSTFSTSHQNVNVYGQPEMRYEVRSEDTAIDIQLLDNRESL